MKSVASIFLIDGLSKFCLAITTFALIRHMPIPEYALYSVVFSCVMVSFQAVCGLIERTYISDADAHVDQGRAAITMLSVATFCVVAVYLAINFNFRSAFIALLVAAICVVFQCQRIYVQRESKFTTYMLLDFLRNGLFLVGISGLFMANRVTADGVMSVYGLSSIAAMIFLKQPVIFKSFFSSDLSSFQRGKSYLWRIRYLVGYSLLSSIAPYIALFLVSRIGTVELIATYGAALRYQAIFAMMVFAFNAVAIVKFSNLENEASSEFRKFYRQLPFFVAIFLILLLAIWLVIPIVDGNKYPLLRNAYLILSVCSFCSFAATPAINYLLSVKKYMTMFYTLIAGLGLMTISPLALSKYSYNYGILFGVLLGYVLISVCNIISATRENS